jgi:hypothetical protein
MHEVLTNKSEQEQAKIGIFLKGCGIEITGVYTKSRSSFNFDCKRPR